MIKENFIIWQIKRGNIVAIPTDTIFGLSCLPTKEHIIKLNQLKQRNPSKGFIVLTSDLKYLQDFISTNDLNKLAIEYQNITTPTTFIVSSFSKLATAHTLAIRLTHNPFITRVCNKLGSAILSTSCNVSGRENIKTLLRLRLFFGKIPALPPKNNNNKSSTIIDLKTRKIIRQ